DRFLAFLVDLVPFYAGFYLALYLTVFRLHRLPNTWPVWHRQMLAWGLFWLAYHALGNMTGGTPGKRLLGLRVEAVGGGPLGAGRSLVRAAGYLVSLPLNLGFLWSLLNPDSRTWHDLLAGSRVVEVRAKSQGTALLSALASLGLVASMVGLSAWSAFVRQTPGDVEAVRKAREGLRILAAVEESYKAAHGSYTDDLAALALQSGDVTAFKEGMSELFDPDGFVIQAGGGEYLLRARARDRRKTTVELTGP
ncbi:MAG: RDD family protein, partial [Elusimicrobia bacterium]|nr:RDD family protein [Elusimicrobiota bacterium]